MKPLHRLFTAAAAVAFLVATPVFGKDCCDAATAKVKKGEACAKCIGEDHACCKDAAKKAAKDLAKEGTKVECKVCAAKKEKKPA
ncbi:MAG: hypothetical protein ACR2OZ_14545 [Verrucomicrobiales bacterium]